MALEGAIKLPRDPEAGWAALQAWCEALSSIRNAVLDGAAWEVRMDDHEIPWDPDARAFDPSR